MRKFVLVRRLGAALAGAVGLILVTASPAAAHATVPSSDAGPGSYGELVFRVPNESDTADTTGLEVVRRTQPARDGAAEPEHPAPTPGIAPTTATEAVNPAAATSQAPASSDTAGSDDMMARELAGAALATATEALVWTVCDGRKAKG